MICKKCSTENEEGAKFCLNCGEPLDNMVSAGYENEEATVRENTGPEQAPSHNETAPVPPYNAPNYYNHPMNDNKPMGEYTNAAQGSYNAPGAQPFVNAAPTMPPVPPYPPYQVPMPNAYMPNPFGFDPYQSKATAAKVCGILSIIVTAMSCGMLWVIGLILGIVGITMGASYQNKVFPQNRSKARTGLVCGIIGTVMCVIVFIFAVIVRNYLNSSAGQDLFREFQEQIDTIIRPFIL